MNWISLGKTKVEMMWKILMRIFNFWFDRAGQDEDTVNLEQQSSLRFIKMLQINAVKTSKTERSTLYNFIQF